MIRHAAELQRRGTAPIAEAGFLNFSRPSFAEALARCVERGAVEVTIQPYFLIPGHYVRSTLPALVDDGRAAHPAVTLQVAEPFGDHPALADLVVRRLRRAEGAPATTAVVLLAHGSPDTEANGAIHRTAERVAQQTGYPATVAFLECNAPNIPEGVAAAVERGAERIVAVPYFLHAGRHVREDLPNALAAARVRHPGSELVLAEHLAYSDELIEVVQDRVNEAQPGQIDLREACGAVCSGRAPA